MQKNTETRRPNMPDRIDFICKTRYSNTLPDLPFEPKFLEAPFISLNRFVEYKPTSLEKNYKYELLTEPDLNVKIDLIDPMTYYFNPNNRTPLHPKDEKLLEDENVSQQNSKRSQQHSKIVPWMRKTEYISTEFNRFGVGSERQEARVGYGVKRKLGTEHVISYKNRDSQIAAINRTFSDAKKPVKKHYSKPRVYAVEELPIFPDFEMWAFPFAQVIFDADPLPLCKEGRENKLNHAILRGIMDSEGNQFVGYFSPTESAIQQKLLDDQHITKDTVEVDRLGSFKAGFEYEHILEREYTWTVKNKATAGYEQENYFFVFRGNFVYYNELESRVRLVRRIKSANSKSSILMITYREPNLKETKNMETRLRQIINPFDVHEEEDVEEEDEEEKKTNDQKIENVDDEKIEKIEKIKVEIDKNKIEDEEKRSEDDEERSEDDEETSENNLEKSEDDEDKSEDNLENEKNEDDEDKLKSCDEEENSSLMSLSSSSVSDDND